MSNRAKALLAKTSDVLRVEFRQGEFHLTKTSQTRKQRFMAKVDTSVGPDACWRWKGSVTQQNGYGQIFDISPTSGRKTMRPAHRVSLEIDRGISLGTSQRVLHARGCSKLCVNPKHLRIGTAAQNTADARAEGRLSGSKLNADQVRKIVSLKRDHGVECFALSERFGVSETTIASILKGQTWGAVTGIVRSQRKGGRPPKVRLAA